MLTGARNTTRISKTFRCLRHVPLSSSRSNRLTMMALCSLGMQWLISWCRINTTRTTLSWVSLASISISFHGCTSSQRSRLLWAAARHGGSGQQRLLLWPVTGSCSPTAWYGAHCLPGPSAWPSYLYRTSSPCRYTYRSPYHTGACRPRILARWSLSPSDNCEPPWTSTAQPGSTLFTVAFSSRQCIICSHECPDTTSGKFKSS